jgi:hypothetical protein
MAIDSNGCYWHDANKTQNGKQACITFLETFILDVQLFITYQTVIIMIRTKPFGDADSRNKHIVWHYLGRVQPLICSCSFIVQVCACILACVDVRKHIVSFMGGVCVYV